MVKSDDIYGLLESVGAPEEVKLYGLVDHAGLPGILPRFSAAGTEWLSLFEGQREAGALSAAPLLFEVRTREVKRAQRGLLRWICQHGAYTSSLMFIASPLCLDQLALNLAMRLEASISENILVLLRFFDPRVFESMMIVLSDTQRKDFLHIGFMWWYLGQSGNIMQEAGSNELVHHTLHDRLILTVEQENALIDASEPYQVMDMLRSNLGALFSALPVCHRDGFVKRHIAAAKSRGIEITHELAFYCALALIYGEDFSKEVKWNEALGLVSAKQNTLAEAAETYGDDD